MADRNISVVGKMYTLAFIWDLPLWTGISESVYVGVQGIVHAPTHSRIEQCPDGTVERSHKFQRGLEGGSCFGVLSSDLWPRIIRGALMDMGINYPAMFQTYESGMLVRARSVRR